MAKNRHRELKPTIAVASPMSEPNDPKGDDLRPFAINVAISLAVMVLLLAALQMV